MHGDSSCELGGNQTISADELRALLTAKHQMHYPSHPVIWFLILEKPSGIRENPNPNWQVHTQWLYCTSSTCKLREENTRWKAARKHLHDPLSFESLLWEDESIFSSSNLQPYQLPSAFFHHGRRSWRVNNHATKSGCTGIGNASCWTSGKSFRLEWTPPSQFETFEWWPTQENSQTQDADFDRQNVS